MNRSIKIANQLLLNDADNYNVYIADDGFFDKIKNWVKDKWNGFKNFPFNKKSEAINYIKYNKKKKVLEIKFQQRGTYQYFGVNENVLENFLRASSKGRFFNKVIRDRFNYKKVASIAI